MALYKQAGTRNRPRLGGAEEEKARSRAGSAAEGEKAQPRTDSGAEALREQLQQHTRNRPGPYESPWKASRDQAAEQLLNRESFSYDANEDALYQQLLQNYTRQGQLAMLDTMGHAQAMTGGYGNSYAQNVGQQVYQGYLREAAEQLPEYYALAREAYDREGDALRDRYSLLEEQEAGDYSRYQDALAEYYDRLDQLQNRYDQARDFEYQQSRDEIADQQWQKEYDEGVRQWEYAQGISDADGNRIQKPSYGYGQPPEEEEETGEDPSGGGFAGSTYSEAVAYMQQGGVPPQNAAAILTQREWQQAHDSGSGRYGANRFDSYAEYLKYTVGANLSAYGKK